MKSVVEKERELSLYLEEWVAARYHDWNTFYQATTRNREYGIYRLKSGSKLLDLLNDIMGNIEEYLGFDDSCHIIPSKFSSIPQLLQFLGNFKKHINSRYHLIEENFDGENTDSDVVEIYKMCIDIDQMVTRCQKIYLSDNSIPIPYLEARCALENNDVDKFFKFMGSLIKNVPFNIHKEKLNEGYFHTIVHVITSVLGMSPVSESETADGRIDMMIEYPERLYIIEFKYSADDSDRSGEALRQIKEKEYAKAYFIKGKTIEGIGVSFSQSKPDVLRFVKEILFQPQISLY